MTLFDYFEFHWRRSDGVYRKEEEDYQYSGMTLLDRIKPDETVIDIGCGYNLFKPHLGKRLLGIDPANNAADIRSSIEEFYSEKQYDVAFVLGSLNFGSEETISCQCDFLYDLVKPGGRVYWRQNPGEDDHEWDNSHTVDFYKWSFDKNHFHATNAGFEVDTVMNDTKNRIFAIWTKPSC